MKTGFLKGLKQTFTSKVAGGQSKSGRKRFFLLDELRGLTLISMILYHFMWDLAYIVGVHMPWYSGDGGYIWQQSICWTFILLSGFCWSFGRRPLKRGVIIFFWGMVITAVTFLLGEGYMIFFGILTLLGSSMVLLIPTDFVLNRLLSGISHKAIKILLLMFLMFTCLAMFLQIKHHSNILSADFERNLFTAYLGFPSKEFHSEDYFPLLPWGLLYATGYLLHKLCAVFTIPGSVCARIAEFARISHIPPLSFLGRNCLIIYLLHQPVLYVISMIIRMAFAQS